MVEAMLWILRTGAPWRDLPPCYGPWQSIYTRFRRWTLSGVWARVLVVLSADFDDEHHFFQKLKRFRRVATRYEKKARNFLAFVHLASIMIWLA